MNIRRGAAVLPILALTVFAPVACASSDDGESSSSSSSSSSTSGEQQSALKTSDGWIKAVPAESKMTAVFVTLENTTDKDITVKSATTDMSAKAELHEMVEKDGQMVMQESPDGLKVPAGESLMLKPGGFHVMVMGLEKPVAAGEKHTITLTLDDGTEVTFEAIAKEFSGANESYQPGGASHSG